MQQLSEGTLLQGGKYKIDKMLGQGGFGITYLATQVLLGRKVCIKEFFFKQFCERDETTSHVTLGTKSNREFVDKYMNKFIKEARTISQLDHPHIIRIHDIFEENSTAYYVMEFHSGGSLGDLVKDGRPLPETDAVKYITQIADAVGYIHKRNINHLDIKPGNILIDARGCGVLIDFGLSKQYDEQGSQTSSTPVGISHGYAPMEQYNQNGVSTFSPQSDIYSLGATLYKLVTGATPPQANEIFNDGLPALPAHLSDGVKKAIEQAMQPRKKERPATVKEFLALLSGGSASAASSTDEATKIIAEPEETLVVTPKVEPIQPVKPVEPVKRPAPEHPEDTQPVESVERKDVSEKKETEPNRTVNGVQVTKKEKTLCSLAFALLSWNFLVGIVFCIIKTLKPSLITSTIYEIIIYLIILTFPVGYFLLYSATKNKAVKNVLIVTAVLTILLNIAYLLPLHIFFPSIESLSIVLSLLSIIDSVFIPTYLWGSVKRNYILNKNSILYINTLIVLNTIIGPVLYLIFTGRGDTYWTIYALYDFIIVILLFKLISSKVFCAESTEKQYNSWDKFIICCFVIGIILNVIRKYLEYQVYF